MNLATLFVSTAYTGAFKLFPTTTPPNNSLTVDGHATIRGGVFSLGDSSNGQANELTVKGKLIVRDTATFDVNGQDLFIGVDVEISTGAVLRSYSNFAINRAIP